MGVINVTPDSFSDAGRFFDRRAAVEQGLRMAAEGADIIDIGGESTRPGAEPVPEEEELDRVLPVIEGLHAEADVAISVDTRKADVAAAALEAGAVIVNDVSAGSDLRMFEVVRNAAAGMVLMHMRGDPKTMQQLTSYDDVVEEVKGFLAERVRAATDARIEPERLAVDPGLGFAKTPEQSLQLLAGLDELTGTGWPVVVGTSRKSFIGATLGVPEDQRLEGTAATVAWAVAKGARVVRVHDVEAMSRVVRMTEAIAAALEPAE